MSPSSRIGLLIISGCLLTKAALGASEDILRCIQNFQDVTITLQTQNSARPLRPGAIAQAQLNEDGKVYLIDGYFLGQLKSAEGPRVLFLSADRKNLVYFDPARAKVFLRDELLSSHRMPTVPDPQLFTRERGNYCFAYACTGGISILPTGARYGGDALFQKIVEIVHNGPRRVSRGEDFPALQAYLTQLGFKLEQRFVPGGASAHQAALREVDRRLDFGHSVVVGYGARFEPAHQLHVGATFLGANPLTQLQRQARTTPDPTLPQNHATLLFGKIVLPDGESRYLAYDINLRTYQLMDREDLATDALKSVTYLSEIAP